VPNGIGVCVFGLFVHIMFQWRKSGIQKEFENNVYVCSTTFELELNDKNWFQTSKC
jgi:hypothetical protein